MSAGTSEGRLCRGPGDHVGARGGRARIGGRRARPRYTENYSSFRSHSSRCGLYPSAAHGCCGVFATRASFPLPFALCLLPFAFDEVCERALKVRVDELEVALDESFGQAAATCEREFGFRPQKQRADAHEPGRHARTPRSLQGAAQLAHELGVRHRARPRRVEDAFRFTVLDAPEDEAAEVAHVEPAYVLVAFANRAAEINSGEAREAGKRAAVAPQNEADAQQNFSRRGKVERVEGGLPT